MTEKQITNPQRSAEEIARERIRTCETARDDGHALSQFALDDLVLCRAFLALVGGRQAAFELIAENGCDCDEDEGPMPEGDLAAHRCLAGRIEHALTRKSP